jgi:hypothetical protein
MSTGPAPCRSNETRENNDGRFFKKFVDANDQVQVINTRQIVRVFQSHHRWDVLLTTGEPITLNASEAEKLFKTVPVAQAPTAGPAKTK